MRLANGRRKVGSSYYRTLLLLLVILFCAGSVLVFLCVKNLRRIGGGTRSHNSRGGTVGGTVAVGGHQADAGTTKKKGTGGVATGTQKNKKKTTTGYKEDKKTVVGERKVPTGRSDDDATTDDATTNNLNPGSPAAPHPHQKPSAADADNQIPFEYAGFKLYGDHDNSHSTAAAKGTPGTTHARPGEERPWVIEGLEAVDFLSSVPKNQEPGGWKHDGATSAKLFSSRCDVERVDARKMTKEIFEREYEHKKPVIFVDPSMKTLFNHRSFLHRASKSILVQSFGNTTILTARAAVKELDGGGGYNSDPSSFGKGNAYTLQKYIEKMERPWSLEKAEAVEKSDYLLGGAWVKEDALQSLAKQAPIPLTEKYMPPQELRAKPLFILGPTGSGTPFHQHSPAWATLWYGMKRWFLRPSFLSVPLPRTEGSRRNTTGQWLFSSWHGGYPAVREQDDAEARRSNVSTLLECVQVPGETLYIPVNWWHSTLNVVQTVSVTQLDFSNLDENIAGLKIQQEVDEIQQEVDEFDPSPKGRKEGRDGGGGEEETEPPSGEGYYEDQNTNDDAPKVDEPGAFEGA